MGSVHGQSPCPLPPPPMLAPSISCQVPCDLGYTTSFFVSCAVWKWVSLPQLRWTGVIQRGLLREVFRANNLLLPEMVTRDPPPPNRDSICCHTPGHHIASSVSRSSVFLYLIKCPEDTTVTPSSEKKTLLPSLSFFICKTGTGRTAYKVYKGFPCACLILISIRAVSRTRHMSEGSVCPSGVHRALRVEVIGGCPPK